MDKRTENHSSTSEEEVVTSTEILSVDTNKPGLYIIYSRWSLSRIDKEITLSGKIGLLRIICDAGKETNRTLALLENDVYDKLCHKGYSDKKSNKGFSIVKFNEKALDLPPKGFTKNLFVRVPEIFRKDDVKTIEIIDEKIKHLVGWEVLPENSWHVNAVLESREKGSISSGCFIVFDSKVELVTIAKVKMLITDTLWPTVSEDVEREYFKCSWAFDSRKKDHKKDDKKTEKKAKPEDDKKSKRKIKTETGDESEQKIKPRNGKKYERKIKAEMSKEDDEENEVVTQVVLIPTVSHPVEMLDDIVTEENDS